MIRMSDPGRIPGKYEQFAELVKKAKVGGGLTASVFGVAALVAKFGPDALETVKNVARSAKK